MNIGNESQNKEPTKAIVTNQFSKKHNDLPVVSLVFGIIFSILGLLISIFILGLSIIGATIS